MPVAVEPSAPTRLVGRLLIVATIVGLSAVAMSHSWHPLPVAQAAGSPAAVPVVTPASARPVEFRPLADADHDVGPGQAEPVLVRSE
jgi:hypothetical protein